MTLNQVHLLVNLINSLSNESLSLKTGYKLIKLKDYLEKDANYFITKLSEIVTKYSDKDDFGNPIQNEMGIQIKDEFLEACNNELVELQNIEVEIPNIKFNIEELENINLKLSDIELFKYFLED